MNKKGFGISSIQDIGTGDNAEITTNPDETPSTITITKYDDKKITSKDNIWDYFKERGLSDEQIARITYETILKSVDYQIARMMGDCNMKTKYIMVAYPGIDTIEIPGAKKSEIEHWPNEDGIGEYFKHRLMISPYDMEIIYQIYDKRVLLESFMIQDIRLGFWAHMDWEKINPFEFSCVSKNILIDDIPFKSWKNYFSVESIKNYAIEHGAHENFLTAEYMFY